MSKTGETEKTNAPVFIIKSVLLPNRALDFGIALARTRGEIRYAVERTGERDTWKITLLEGSVADIRKVLNIALAWGITLVRAPEAD